MNKTFLLIIALAILVLSLACGQTVGTFNELPTVQPTLIVAKLPTVTPPDIVILVAPEETAYVSLRWHLRQGPRAGGVTVSFVENEMVTIIQVDQDTGWYKVIAGGKVGWLSPLAIGEK